MRQAVLDRRKCIQARPAARLHRLADTKIQVRAAEGEQCIEAQHQNGLSLRGCAILVEHARKAEDKDAVAEAWVWRGPGDGAGRGYAAGATSDDSYDHHDDLKVFFYSIHNLAP